MAEKTKITHFKDYQGKVFIPLKEREEISSDFKSLRLFSKIPLFVYGSTKKGGLTHFLIESNKFFSKAHTLTPAFNMMKTKGGKEAILFQEELNTQDSSKRKNHYARGELWVVTPETILVLDHWFRKKYKRIISRILVEEVLVNTLKTHRGLNYISTYLYVGNPDYWDTTNENLLTIPSVKYTKSYLLNKQFQEFDPSIRISSPHRGITDLFDGLDQPPTNNNDNNDIATLEAEHPYGGLPANHTQLL